MVFIYLLNSNLPISLEHSNVNVKVNHNMFVLLNVGGLVKCKSTVKNKWKEEGREGEDGRRGKGNGNSLLRWVANYCPF